MFTTDKGRYFRRCVTGSSALALATALAAGPAGAQLSYNAPDPTVVSGSVNFQRGSTPGVETYTVTSPTAVLDFTPSDTSGTGVINFQNGGTSVTYQGSSDFTVLNRIVPTDPTRAIQFNGTVNSRINTTAGGSVWFYSPGGILLGSGAVFDVGSLLLSTADPTEGTGTIGSTTSFRLKSNAGSNADITIFSGAQITASAEGSYIALVAPVIRQNGDVRVNGSAAYVAAEEATLSINQGLFDISVAVGSDNTDGFPLMHGGSTSGPSSTGVGDNHGIYMVAVPKNTAITMLIFPSGQLGFDTAASASIENGAIYLQAGGNLSVDPAQTIVNRIATLPQSALGASIQLTAPAITSNIAAQATTDTNVTVANGGTTLSGDAYFYGGKNATLTAPGETSFTSTKSVIVNSFGNGAPGRAQIDALADSTMSFASLLVSADPLSGRAVPVGFDLTTGGSAALRSTSGIINASGPVRVTAQGVASGSAPTSTFGGTADISVAPSGSINLASDVFIDASASTTGAANLATGGGATMFANGGSIKLLSGLSVTASATGSQGAAAKGGNATVTTGTGGGAIEVTGGTTVDGGALGGSADFANGGLATAGTAVILGQDASATAPGSIKLSTVSVIADANGGNVASGGGTGGNSVAGTARVTSGANTSYRSSGQTLVSTTSRGGNGGQGGAGGAATSGSAWIASFGGAVSFDTATMTINANGGAGGAGAGSLSGGAGGAASPGSGIDVLATKGGTISGKSITNVTAATGGAGGAGGSTSASGVGGNAAADRASVFVDTGGSITLTNTLNLSGTATGGAMGAGTAQVGQVGGSATGGNMTVNVNNGNLSVGDLQVFGGATGGTGFAGGAATGGQAGLFTGASGKFTVTAANLVLNTVTAGGVGASGGVGGKATGGTSQISGAGLLDSSATNTIIDARAFGGSLASGAAGGTAGAAQGGTARIDVSGPTAVLRNAIVVQAGASGGSGASSKGGNGGDAAGGSASFHANGAVVTLGNITLAAGTIGGQGGTGPADTVGGGNGGAASPGSGPNFFVDNGAKVAGANATLTADARGGDGGNGFSAAGLAGNGGSATAAPAFVGTNTNGQITLASLTVGSNATAGSTGTGIARPGGVGGAATGGAAAVNANTGLIQVSNLSVRSDVFGGNGFALGANGGAATSGSAAINATNNGTLKITGGSITLSTEAFGGDASGVAGGSVVSAGEATGGTANIFAGTGGTIDSSATFVSLDASGDGGAEFGNGNVNGAIGRGGHARVNANGGTITLRSEVEMIADGSGGDGGGTGNGGAGIGGEARLGTFGALASSKVDVVGDLFLDVSGHGGNGELGKGGDGLGGNPADLTNGPFDKGAYIVATGGSVSVSGIAELDASGFGNFGGAGGGAGTGGLTNIVVFGASINVAGGTSLDSSGVGGDGLNGAAGGIGTGGNSLVSATSGGDSNGGGTVPTGTPGNLTFASIVQNVSGQGGEGGAGALGGAGGSGGDGFGGVSNLVAQAGSGTLKVGNTFMFLQGSGGAGGDGGSASVPGGIGGSGGKGGAGTGGFTNFGTVSGLNTTNNDGSATFTDISVFIEGTGGAGGNGTSGGNGGAGGVATGGNGAILSRGSPVLANTISFDVSAIGGTGGSGATAGVGGDAFGGGASLLSTNRFQRTERGSLTAVSFDATSTAIGGTGSTTGASTAGRMTVQVSKADATLDSLSVSTFGDNPPPAGSESTVSVDNGTLLVNGAISASLTGDLALLSFNGGVVKADSLFLNVTGSLLPPPAGTVVTPGIIDIGSDFTALFGGDFVTISNFNIAGSLDIEADGALQTGNVTASSVRLDGTKSVKVGDVRSADDILITSGAGPLVAGNLTSGTSGSTGSINLVSAGDMIVGNLSAADSIFASSRGTLTGGDLTAGLGNQASIFGEVDLTAVGAITLGDIVAPFVDISTDSSTMISLDLDFTAVAGSPSFYVLNDDFNLPVGFANAVLTITDLNFDDRGIVLLNKALVDNAGINGPGLGNLVTSPGGPNNQFNYTRPNGFRNVVVTSGLVEGQNAFRLLVNDTNNGIFGDVLPNGVNISSASISANVSFTTGAATNPATIQTGSIKAETIDVNGQATVRTGDLKAGNFYAGLVSDDDFVASVRGVGNVTTGNISSLEYVGLGSLTGSITAGTIDVGKSALLLAKTDVTTGAITGGTGQNNDIFISNVSIVDSDPAFAGLDLFGETDGDFDPAILSTATPVRLEGGVTINGPVTTGGFAAAAAGGFQTGSISAPNRLLLDSGASFTLGDLTTSGVLNLTTGGAMQLGNLTAGAVALKASQGVTTGSITATSAVNVTAGTLASFLGLVSAPQITVTSTDLNLGTSGRLGTPNTQQLTLVSTNTAPLTFGGGAIGGAYNISAAEAQGLRARTISISTSGPVTIGAVSLTGGGSVTGANIVGDTGQLTINAGGDINVLGGFAVTNATANNRVTLRSTGRLAVTTETGSLAIFGANASTPAGTLELIGNSIVVGSQSILSQLQANPNFSGRNAALATPATGTPVPEGYVGARRLEFEASSLLAIQNSGSATQFAGFSAGSGGMQVRNRQTTTPLDVFIFGRAADSSGTFKLNDETIGQISFGNGEGAQGGNFVTGSAVNNCVIGASSCGAESPSAPLEQVAIIDRIPATIADAVQGALSSASDPESVAALPTVNLITTIDATQLRTDPVISDPVSGGGNSSLWEDPDEEDERQKNRAKRTPSKGGEQ